MIRYITIIISCLLLLSCNNKQEENYLNKNLIIPDSLPLLIKGDLQKPTRIINESEITILLHLNGNCNSCIENLSIFNEFVSSIKKKYDVNIIIIAHIYDIPIFNDFSKDIILNYPIYADKYDEFYYLNKFKDINRYNAFIIDYENNVIATGDVIYSKKASTRFQEIISNHFSNN